jgi:phage terminase large subunit-like protein
MVPERFIRTKADRLAIEAGCYFDQEQADKVIRFAESYFAPQFIGGKFQLLEWQKDWLSALYGWRLPDGRRRWRKVLLTLAKKGGKTLLCAIVALYESLAAGVPSPLVISCSTTKENARQIYDEIAHSITKHPKLKPLAKIVASQKIIRFKSKNAELRAISNESGNCEGLNLSACIADEVHAWEGRGGEALYRALEYSTIARPDGVLIIISTAGHDQSHFFYDLVCKARNIIKGDDTDTSFFPTVYEAGTDDDIEDPATWAKANPSLGTSFTAEDFRRDLAAAKLDTASLLSFRRYRLNQWCRADDSYIDAALWDLCKDPATEDVLKSCPLYVGCDLSQTTDTCSVSCVWCLGDRRYYVRNHAWVCEDGVRKREQTNLPRYQQYAQQGTLTITPGTCNDYRRIRAYLMELRQRYNLKAISFDQYNAIEMCAELMAEGCNVLRQGQNHKEYNGPTKEFEIAVRERRISHDGNEMLKWALQNTRLDINTFGDVKPSRAKSTDKIDPAVSTLLAFKVAMLETAGGTNRECVYNSRPIMWL